MEEYKFKWQIFAGVGVLLILVATIFMPRLSVSGNKYVNMAVDVNQYALDKDEDKAKTTNAEDIINDYGSDTDTRDTAVEKYDEEIKEKTGDYGKISGLFLGKWAMTVDDTLYFSGITFKPEKKIEESGVQDTFKILGMLIYIPVIFSISLIIFMLIKRQTYAKFLIAGGGLSIISELLIKLYIPSAIWKSTESYIDSFSLISPDVLSIEGVGKETIHQIFSSFGLFTGTLVIVLGCILVIEGILFLTVLKPKPYEEEDDFDFIFKTGPNGNVNGMEPIIPAVQPGGNPQSGSITGVSGQYLGQTIQIMPGEEIILGRDPRYCMLVFEYPKVSRRHCGIRYDAVSGSYQVIDYSTNGTKLSDGTLVSTSQYVTVRPGTVVYLGNSKEALRLG